MIETDPNTGAALTYYVASDGVRYLNGAQSDGQHACCFVSDPNQIYLSKGVDAEIGGQLLPGWQISAGYTFSKNENKGLSFGAKEGTPFVSQQPEHLLKVWTTYALPGNAWRNGITFGAGVNAMSRAYYLGTSCVALNPPNAQGISTCKTSVPYQFAQPASAVFSGRVDYKLNNTWAVALNVNNLTDKRYYQTTGGVDSGNWYGDPRNYMLTLRGSF
ncbi:MAG: TonB-dependent receptor [Gammaproteobacteria bacterium]